MKTLEAMTREERSLLLFLESCAVDNIGRVKVKHMSVEDMNIAVRWNKEGFLKFGRIYSKDVTEAGSHWCILTDEAWQLASEERKARAKRTLSKCTWRFADEAKFTKCGHREIVHEINECPLCRALEEISGLENEIEKLKLDLASYEVEGNKP